LVLSQLCEGGLHDSPIFDRRSVSRSGTIVAFEQSVNNQQVYGISASAKV
jgi:hypothetical protein